MNRVRRYGASKEGGKSGNLPADISAVGTANANMLALAALVSTQDTPYKMRR